MLIMIRTGRDRKTYIRLQARVTELESEVRDLRTYVDAHEHGEYLTGEELDGKFDEEFDEMDARVSHMDYWKADRNHSHPAEQPES